MRKMFNVFDSSKAQDCRIFRKREKSLFYDIQIFSVIGSYEHFMARQLISLQRWKMHCSLQKLI